MAAMMQTVQRNAKAPADSFQISLVESPFSVAEFAMPSPVASPTGGWMADSAAVVSAPGCGLLVAQICTEWAYVESALTRMFAVAVGRSTHLMPNGLPSGQRAIDSTAWMVMEALHSIEMQAAVIGKVFARRLTPALTKTWKGVRKELKACGDLRNIVVHTPWCYSADYPDSLLRLAPNGGHGDFLRYTGHDFAQILAKLRAARTDASQFVDLVVAEEMAAAAAQLAQQQPGVVQSRTRLTPPV